LKTSESMTCQFYKFYLLGVRCTMTVIGEMLGRFSKEHGEFWGCVVVFPKK
jgi:hypothetical protein